MNRTRCWKCGGTKEITRHHVIPRYLKPKKNKTIPLCKKCHTELHDSKHLLNEHVSVSYTDVITFQNVIQKDGTVKTQGSLRNGKVVFPDRAIGIKIIPGVKYLCVIREMSNMGFAIKAKKYHRILNYSSRLIKTQV